MTHAEQPNRRTQATRRVHHRVAILALLLSTAYGCQQRGRTTSTREQEVQSLVNVREVRVLIGDRKPTCRLRVTGPFVLRDRTGQTILRDERADWTSLSVDSSRRLRFGNHTLGPNAYDLVPQHDGTIELSLVNKSGKSSAPRRYAGRLRLSVNAAGRPRVINFIDIETYVACVLPGELFPYFEQEAFRAQAVAIRTYVLYQMAQRPNKAYDVAATEASQVYPGLRTGTVAGRAREAAAFTKGIVATWTSPDGERLFCTFYSSCCGGRTQDVANCRTDPPSIPPLAGGVPCNCPKIATSYRWKNVRITKDEVTRKIVARYPAMKNIGRIESIRVIRRTKWSRPITLRLVGSSGDHHDIRAENFRLALGSRTLRSSNFTLRTSRNHFEFADGKGFGHAMGLCQWGMQEMALTGRSAAAILKHYYPTMNLTRAY